MQAALQAPTSSRPATRVAAPARRSAPRRGATAPAAARRPAVVFVAATAEDDVAAAPAAAAVDPAPASAGGDDDAAGKEAAAASKFSLNFLWMDKNIGVAVDQVYTKGQRAPLTEYYMWPRKDAWEELKAALEAKPWVPARDRVVLLNRTTEVINFWQDDAAKHGVEEARAKFPDCLFSSS